MGTTRHQPRRNPRPPLAVPDDIWLLIVDFADGRSLAALEGTCRRLRQLLSPPSREYSFRSGDGDEATGGNGCGLDASSYHRSSAVGDKSSGSSSPWRTVCRRELPLRLRLDDGFGDPNDANDDDDDSGGGEDDLDAYPQPTVRTPTWRAVRACVGRLLAGQVQKILLPNAGLPGIGDLCYRPREPDEREDSGGGGGDGRDGMDEGGRGGSDEVNEVDEVVSTQRDDWWEEVDSATSENDDDDDDDDDDCESDDGDSELGPTELEDLRADSGVPLEDLVGPGWPSLAPTEEPDMLDPFTERAFLPLFPVLDRRGGGGLAPSARLPPRLARRMHGRTPGPKFPRSWVATFVLDRSREDADPLLLPFLELKYQQPSPSFSFEAGFSMGRFIMAHHRARIGYNQFWYDHDLALVEDNQFPVTYAYRYQREEYNAFQADDRLTVAAASCGRVIAWVSCPKAQGVLNFPLLPSPLSTWEINLTTPRLPRAAPNEKDKRTPGAKNAAGFPGDPQIVEYEEPPSIRFKTWRTVRLLELDILMRIGETLERGRILRARELAAIVAEHSGKPNKGWSSYYSEPVCRKFVLLGRIGVLVVQRRLVIPETIYIEDTRWQSLDVTSNKLTVLCVLDLNRPTTSGVGAVAWAVRVDGWNPPANRDGGGLQVRSIPRRCASGGRRQGNPASGTPAAPTKMPELASVARISPDGASLLFHGFDPAADVDTWCGRPVLWDFSREPFRVVVTDPLALRAAQKVCPPPVTIANLPKLAYLAWRQWRGPPTLFVGDDVDEESEDHMQVDAAERDDDDGDDSDAVWNEFCPVAFEFKSFDQRQAELLSGRRIHDPDFQIAT